MGGYIRTGRFGDFVKGVIAEKNRRTKEEAERDEDNKMWLMYCLMGSHGFISDKSFSDWKKEVLRPASAKNKTGSDADLNDDGIKAIYNDLFPER
jgi:hypothetical protein